MMSITSQCLLRHHKSKDSFIRIHFILLSFFEFQSFSLGGMGDNSRAAWNKQGSEIVVHCVEE